MLMRLQRFMAQAGVASRRKAEELITAGRVRVNGKVVTELGTKVDPRKDQVTVGDKHLAVEQHVYLLLHKPRGYVTTLSDPEGRPTVMELLKNVAVRLYPVGRLDFNTEGVLLLTNDGDLAHALMHPSGEVEKTYEVKLRGVALPDVVESFRKGVTLDDGSRTAPAKVSAMGPTEGGSNSWLEVTIHEGKNRQIHRMAEALGHQVAKLQRVRYAGLELGALRPGSYRALAEREVDGLRRLVGMKTHGRPGPRAEPRGEGARTPRERSRRPERDHKPPEGHDRGRKPPERGRQSNDRGRKPNERDRKPPERGRPSNDRGRKPNERDRRR